MSTETVGGGVGGGPYVTTYEADGDVTLSTALVFAVAEARGDDPIDLAGPDDPRLADAVDPDVLDTLPQSGADSWTFEIEVWDCRVVVTGEGTITVASA